jgi:hypothetical protein
MTKKNTIDPNLMGFSGFKKAGYIEEPIKKEEPNKKKKLSKLEQLNSNIKKVPYKRKTKEELELEKKKIEENNKKIEEEKKKKEELEKRLIKPEELGLTKLVKNIDEIDYKPVKHVVKVEKKIFNEDDINLDNLDIIEKYYNTNFPIVLIKKLLKYDDFLDRVSLYKEVLIQSLEYEEDEIEILNLILNKEQEKEFPIVDNKIHLITIINDLYSMLIISHSSVEQWISNINLTEKRIKVK